MTVSVLIPLEWSGQKARTTTTRCRKRNEFQIASYIWEMAIVWSLNVVGAGPLGTGVLRGSTPGKNSGQYPLEFFMNPQKDCKAWWKGCHFDVRSLHHPGLEEWGLFFFSCSAHEQHPCSIPAWKWGPVFVLVFLLVSTQGLSSQGPGMGWGGVSFIHSGRISFLFLGLLYTG